MDNDSEEHTSYYRPTFGGDRSTPAERDTHSASVPAGAALLVVRRGPNAGAHFLLDADVCIAGRSSECGIVLDDPTVSRQHVKFCRENERFVARDAGSLNGTYINRHPTDVTVLTHGDEIQIGKFRLVFLTA